MLNNGHILTALEMQQSERALIDQGTPVEDLMRRAGQGAAREIWRISADMSTLVFCGPGNNGGDGYVIAQWLHEKGVEVSVASSGEPKTDAAKHAQSLWTGLTVSLEKARPSPQFVDCLFGTGLKRPVEGLFLEHYQRLSAGSRRHIAIDLPSGIETDSGVILNDFGKVDLTIALGAFKPAHYLEPARSSIGSLIGVDIGVAADSGLSVLQKPKIAELKPCDHKYKRGLVAIVAGAMPGAANLAALAAQKAGAGYVKVFAPTGYQSPNQSIVVEYYSDSRQLKDLLCDERISAVVIGPGLGKTSDAATLLDIAIASEKPLLVDADALVLLGTSFSSNLKRRDTPVVATPHQGEFLAISDEIDGTKVDQVCALAEAANAVILSKGSDTVVANADGEATIANSSSSWLSIAGTGDILAGIIAAQFGANADPYIAAKTGQWLHTRAAQLAGPAFSPEILIEYIPSALAECL